MLPGYTAPIRDYPGKLLELKIRLKAVFPNRCNKSISCRKQRLNDGNTLPATARVAAGRGAIRLVSPQFIVTRNRGHVPATVSAFPGFSGASGTAAVPPSSSCPVPFVVLDACVLMSGIVRRLMLRLAAEGVYQPVWSERIGEEWRRNAARLWAIPPDILAAQWAEMNQLFPLASEADLQAYEAGLRYSDPKDFHVIAAGLARRARCGLQQPPQVLVATWNLKDFNRSELRRQGLDALNPDRLLSQWWQADAARLHGAIRAVPADYVALGRDPEPLAATLHRERLYRLKALVAHGGL